MGTTMNIIGETITADALWGQVGTVMPVVLTVVLFAFGYRLVKRLLGGIRTAKVRMQLFFGTIQQFYRPSFNISFIMIEYVDEIISKFVIFIPILMFLRFFFDFLRVILFDKKG